MKIKVYLLTLITFLINQNNFACDAYAPMCYSGTLVSNEIIVVGTITNSFTNSVELNVTDVLFGIENNNTLTVWDGTTIECNGPWPHDANDMGTIGDTILCMIEPIISVENTWDVIGDYRRPSILGGDTYTNFSEGWLFEGTYNYNEVLELDFGMHCCNSLSPSFSVNIFGLPISTSSTAPINLTGYPAGGSFSGTGIAFNAFNPSLAGAGNHTITYTFIDEFGCSFSTQQDIFVFTISYNFVSYNLGTLAPKIGNSIQMEMELPVAGDLVFQVSDLNGQIHYNQTEHFEKGIWQQEISFNQKLSKGIYLLTVSGKQMISTKKFIVPD